MTEKHEILQHMLSNKMKAYQSSCPTSLYAFIPVYGSEQQIGKRMHKIWWYFTNYKIINFGRVVMCYKGSMTLKCMIQINQLNNYLPLPFSGKQPELPNRYPFNNIDFIFVTKIM